MKKIYLLILFIINLTLHVAAAPGGEDIKKTSYQAAIEVGETYLFGCQTYTAAGEYINMISSAASGDSITILTLHVIVAPIQEETYGDTIATECTVFTWYEHTCDASGDYVHTFFGGNAVGGDSIVTLHFTLLNTIVKDITSSTATILWRKNEAVTQYDINVYTSETHFAQYIVGANGQILSSQRFVPSIYKHKLDTTTSSTEYFTISLDGLSAGTDYTYTIEGTNAESVPIYHEEGTFTTLNEDEEGLFDAVADDPRKQAQKLLRGDVLFIERNDKIYNLNGIEVQTTNQ